MTEMRIEVLPEHRVLAEGSITRTRDVTEDPIELEVHVIFLEFKIWEESCIVVGYKESW